MASPVLATGDPGLYPMLSLLPLGGQGLLIANKFKFENVISDPTNQCNSSLCLNGGTCVDLFNDFKCSCASGWTGSQCELGKWQKFQSQNKILQHSIMWSTLSENCFTLYRSYILLSIPVENNILCRSDCWYRVPYHFRVYQL